MDNLLTCRVKVKDKGNEADEAFEAETDEGIQDEADEVIGNCLRNPVIVRNILENFSSPELLKLSLVNKLWKNEARSVMRKQGCFIAYVKSSQSDARGRKVDAFISDFKQMSSVPFSGISINCCFYAPHFDPFPIGALDALQGVELDLSLFKTVSIELCGSWLKNMASPGVLLAKKLLQDCSGVLQELSLCIASEREDFIQKVVQDVIFPRLEVLKLEEYCYEDANEVNRTLYEQYMKAMMSRAPNLKVLHCNLPINVMLSAVQGRAILPVYGLTVFAPFDDIPEDVIGAIKLKHMILEIDDNNEFNFERFNRITPMLLQQSCTTTLRSMCLDSVLAIPLMTYGIGLENVKYLKMDINFSDLENLDPRILEIIKNFDFSRIFPNLTKVEIAPSHDPTPISQDQISSFIQQANAVLREPLPDRAANVKELYLKQKYLSSLATQFFVEMFPNIEKLGVKTALGEDEGVPFVCFWENWVNLKELKVRGNILPASENLDSVFCGIFPEEVAELRKKDEDYLKKVNIVPVMPALTCLKNLRVLWLNNKDRRYAPFQGDATYLFSKVTPLLAFARQPTLAVSLKVSSYPPLFSVVNPPAIAQLIPYVSVTSERLNDDDWDRNGRSEICKPGAGQKIM